MINSLLLLASTSPRRADILETLGLPFRQVHSPYHEPPPTAADSRRPAVYVKRLAKGKAAAAEIAEPAVAASGRRAGHDAQPAGDVPARRIVIAADTIVWHQGQVLGKPRDAAEAVAMLSALRGNTHKVLTGLCLRVVDGAADQYHLAHAVTAVTFRTVSDSWIARYVATGEPLDKAGAYAAQGRGAAIVERINGDFFNVVGLPLAALVTLLETVGAPYESWWSMAAK